MAMARGFREDRASVGRGGATCLGVDKQAVRPNEVDRNYSLGIELEEAETTEK